MRITDYTTKINPENGFCVLVKERARNYGISQSRLISPEAVADLMKNLYQMHERAEEYVYMIALNSKNVPTGVFEVSHGTVNSSIMPTREILIRALLATATNVILVHNHPSGDTNPSAEDIRVTKKLSEACSLIGLHLMDHIIIGHDYKSLKEAGVL